VTRPTSRVSSDKGKSSPDAAAVEPAKSPHYMPVS
jgi:hypothetical protein